MMSRIFRQVLTRGLPKTGQSTSYYNDDDGDLQRGWWFGKTLSNNKTRFVLHSVGGDEIVEDRAFNIVWARRGNGAGGNNGQIIAWPNAFNYAAALNFAGYSSGWRLPNVIEMFSIVRQQYPYSVWPPITSLNPSGPYLTSTTYKLAEYSALVVYVNMGLVDYVNKDVGGYLLVCRDGL